MKWPLSTTTSLPFGEGAADRCRTLRQSASRAGVSPWYVAARTTSGTGGNGGPAKSAATEGATPASSAASIVPGFGGTFETKTPGGSSALDASTTRDLIGMVAGECLDVEPAE